MPLPDNVWSVREKIKCITEYRKRPILWNNPAHSQEAMRARAIAWNEIAAIMQHSVAECQKKIVSCKAVYRKLRRQIRNKKGDVDPIELKWFGYKHMRFLDGRFLEPTEPLEDVDGDTSSGSVVQYLGYVDGSSSGAQNTPPSDTEQPLDDVGEDISSEKLRRRASNDSLDAVEITEHQLKMEECCEDADPMYHQPSTTDNELLDDHTYPGRQEAAGVAESSGMSGVVQRQECSSTVQPERVRDSLSENPYEAFGRYVAAELSSMPRVAAIQLQRRLHECIMDAKLYAVE